MWTNRFENEFLGSEVGVVFTPLMVMKKLFGRGGGGVLNLTDFSRPMNILHLSPSE